MSAFRGRADVACQGLSGPFIATSGHWRYAQITDYTPASEDERASDASRSRSLLPVEFYLGTRPIQAGRSRPDLKAWGLGMEATDNARAQALGCKKNATETTRHGADQSASMVNAARRSLGFNLRNSVRAFLMSCSESLSAAAFSATVVG